MENSAGALRAAAVLVCGARASTTACVPPAGPIPQLFALPVFADGVFADGSLGTAIAAIESTARLAVHRRVGLPRQH
eukprot:643006-Prymnesium_polylepis.2